MAELVKDIEILSKRSNEVQVVPNEEEIKSASEEMIKYLDEHDLILITDKQLGYSFRMFALKFKDETKIFVNPMIIHSEGNHVSLEEDASLEGKYLVSRQDKIELNYQTIFNTFESGSFDGTAADYIQHAVQLLDGVLISEIGLQVDDDFINAPKEEQDQVIEAYLESVKHRNEMMKEAVDKDPEAQKMFEAMDFMIKGARGEVKFEGDEPIPLNRKERRRLKKLGLLDKLNVTIKRKPYVKNEHSDRV